MKKILLLLAFAGHLQAQVNVIVDDDAGADYAPTVAAFKLWDQGKIKLLAYMTDSNNNFSAPAIKAHAIYYRHPTLPIYANQQNTPNNAQCNNNNCNGTAGWTTPFVAQFNPGDVKANYTDCVTGYRTILARLIGLGQKTNIAATGFSTCLYQTMLSLADGISPLTGAQLLQQGVGALYACCGVNPAGTEFNFFYDYPSWSYLFSNWTTANGYPPIWLFSDQDATGTNFGPPAYANAAVNTELAMFNFLGAGPQRPIWDEAVVFMAYCGLACDGVTYWVDDGNGCMSVNSATGVPIPTQPPGWNNWDSGTPCGHHYVSNVASTTVLSRLFDGYTYGFGFAALPPLVGTGVGTFGPVSIKGTVTVK